MFKIFFEGNGARSKLLDFDAPILICCLTSESYLGILNRRLRTLNRKLETFTKLQIPSGDLQRGFSKLQNSNNNNKNIFIQKAYVIQDDFQ